MKCRHCGATVYRREGRTWRYALSDNVAGTDIYGSGSECPKNESGHAAARRPSMDDHPNSGPHTRRGNRMIADDIKRWITNLVAMTWPDEPSRGLDTFPVQPPLPSANDGPPEDFDG